VRRVAVAVLVLALIGGTTAAFTITEALKLEPAPVSSRRAEEVFSPGCGCPKDVVRLTMHLRRDDRLDLDILSEGEPIRNLARDLAKQKGRVRVGWDGRDDAGNFVPDGVYRLRVHLRDADRTIVIPRTIRVDTEPPELELLGVDRAVISPDDDGRRDSTRIGYRAGEDSAALVFVEGRLAARGRLQGAGEADVAWDGRAEGHPLRAGEYTLFVRVRDRAGNLSAPAKVAVEIRYIELVQRVLEVRRGGKLRFRVLTDAERFSWSLQNARGGVARFDAEPGVVVVRLPARTRPGRYILEVEANGHRDRAVVRVLRGRA
jgi:FlgD Ig-like domain